MKSPAYTAQVKIRGKKTHSLSCGCCVLLNLKDKVRWKEAANDISLLAKPVSERIDEFKRYDMISEVDNEDVEYSEYWYAYKS